MPAATPGDLHMRAAVNRLNPLDDRVFRMRS